jgi:hypothetical protein
MEEESPVIYSGASAGLGLKVDLGQLGEFEYAKRPRRLPEVLIREEGR